MSLICTGLFLNVAAERDGTAFWQAASGRRRCGTSCARVMSAGLKGTQSSTGIGGQLGSVQLTRGSGLPTKLLMHSSVWVISTAGSLRGVAYSS